MSVTKRDWKINSEWEIAHNIYFDPNCPKLYLEVPFHLGSSIKIGGLGFGYERMEGETELDKRWLKLKSHQYGVEVKAGASIHNDVNIDRGSWRDTVIGNNARINSKVFIGHNVQIDRGVLIGVGSAISGSCDIGKGVVVWSKAYVEQRCNIGDGAIIGAKAHVRADSEIGPNEVWWGNPAKFQRMRRQNE
jgi:UDP-3-O-[3-hydroxymyristoyl] glucosamine N-acyltransferase